MLRYPNASPVHLRHAYPIAGHWYVKAVDAKGNFNTRRRGHFMLTNSTRVDNPEKPPFDPGTSMSSNELWIPVTNRVDAGVRMYE